MKIMDEKTFVDALAAMGYVVPTIEEDIAEMQRLNTKLAELLAAPTPDIPTWRASVSYTISCLGRTVGCADCTHDANARD